MKILLSFAVAISVAALAGCSVSSGGDTAIANADMVADNLEARADNLEMLADSSENSDAAIAMENLSDQLDEDAANVRDSADAVTANR